MPEYGVTPIQPIVDLRTMQVRGWFTMMTWWWSEDDFEPGETPFAWLYPG